MPTADEIAALVQANERWAATQGRERSGPGVYGPCSKRGYSSERRAREAHRKASWRFRAYLCDCGKYHVTNAEKAGRGE